MVVVDTMLTPFPGPLPARCLFAVFLNPRRIQNMTQADQGCDFDFLQTGAAIAVPNSDIFDEALFARQALCSRLQLTRSDAA